MTEQEIAEIMEGLAQEVGGVVVVIIPSADAVDRKMAITVDLLKEGGS